MKKYRLFYNLNHKTAMPFEVEILRRLGFEVYVPNVVPDDGIGMRSAGQKDKSWDDELTLSKAVLDKLNSTDFYKPVSDYIMKIINKEFDVVFTIADAEILGKYIYGFEGVVIVRAYGQGNDFRYASYFQDRLGQSYIEQIKKIGPRFIFSVIFDGIGEVEPDYIKERSVYMPLGVPDKYFKSSNCWQGGDKHLIFLAPDISHQDYYYRQYIDFKKNFAEYEYRIVGQQTILPNDKNILGYVTNEEFVNVMGKSAAYLYTSDEERHLHYTPVEAMIYGLPVVFNKRNALYKLFDKSPPGAYSNLNEAKTILKKLLKRDRGFIKKIISSQASVLKKMTLSYSESIWYDKFSKHVFPIIELKRESKLKDIWLHSYNFNNYVVVGRANVEAIDDKYKSLTSGVDLFGKKVLDIGEGEGAYSVRLIVDLAHSVTTLCVNEKQLLSCEDVRKSLLVRNWDLEFMPLPEVNDYLKHTNKHFDIVILHGLINFVKNPLDFIQNCLTVANSDFVLEFWAGDEFFSEKAIVIYSSENEIKSGLPPVWFSYQAILNIPVDTKVWNVSYRNSIGDNNRYVVFFKKIAI